MTHYNIDLTATARLPGLDIEVVHHRSTGGDREEISINLQAVLETTNPFVFWAEATKLAWLEAARALMEPSSAVPAAAPTLPKGGSNVLPFSRQI